MLIDANDKPGGMLISCIPAYRLPRNILRKEIESLIDHPSITFRGRVVLGRDITIDELFKEGFKAVFLAMGADKSLKLGLEGENVKGIYSSMEFLKAFNLNGQELAKGDVGIVGGGNSAVDAARVASRQKYVKSVRLLYRRTHQEMPAYAEEVEAALEEGITLETLVSPVKIRYIQAAEAEGVKVETFVQPVKIDARNGHLADIRCIRNKLGDVDTSGRRQPVPIPDSEFAIPLDTLIVAIGERPDSECLASMGLELDKSGRLRVDAKTLCTSRQGVFAGGDLATGPNTVVDAIAAGKRAAEVIDRYLQGKELAMSTKPKLPEVFLEPAAIEEEDQEEATRIEPATISAKSRRKNFEEVELSLSVEQATREARRCLRCDLEFTQHMQDEHASLAAAKGDSL
jgi:NADH-quinone oxidoreductase subunit F